MATDDAILDILGPPPGDVAATIPSKVLETILIRFLARVGVVVLASFALSLPEAGMLLGLFLAQVLTHLPEIVSSSLCAWSAASPSTARPSSLAWTISPPGRARRPGCCCAAVPSCSGRPAAGSA